MSKCGDEGVRTLIDLAEHFKFGTLKLHEIFKESTGKPQGI
jgi:hypothetical protein